jgi:Na+/melibiose symporter-like transporter
MRELFRDARFRLLFLAQVSSMVGDSVLLIVLAIWVKELTGASGLAGAVILAVAAPSLLSPLLGWGVDRVRRRPFLVVLNLATAVALLPLLAVGDRRAVGIIFAVAVAYGFSLILNAAGLAGLLKELVDYERLADANAALRTTREGLRLVGPLAGAGLYALTGAGPVVLVAAATLLIASAVLTAIKVNEQRRRPTELHWAAEFSAGFRHLINDVPLRRTSLAMGAAFLVFGTIQSGIFAYVDQGLHRPATFVAVLLTAMGVGSIAGGLLAPRLIKRVGGPGTVAVGLAALSGGLAGLTYPIVGLGLAAAPLAGFGVSFIAVAFATLMQRRTPAPLMARVSTATDLLVGGPQIASIAAGAVLVTVLPYWLMFAVTATGLAVIASALWIARAEPAPAAAADAPTVETFPAMETTSAIEIHPTAATHPPADRPAV